MLFLVLILCFKLHLNTKNIKSLQSENEIQQNLSSISLKEDTCKSYIDGEKPNNGQDGWDNLPENPQQLLTVCERSNNIVTIRNFVFQKTYSLHASYKKGLIDVSNSNFECIDSKFKYCGVMSSIQLMNIIHEGNHTIANTEFKFCGIKSELTDASIIFIGGVNAKDNFLSNLTFSHNYNETPEEKSQLFQCNRAIKSGGEVPINIYNSTFYNSTGNLIGGSIYFETTNEIKVVRCIFQKYESKEKGGSIYISIKGSFTIDDCKFTENTNSLITYGGAIYGKIDTSDVNLKIFTIQNCCFDNNNVITGGSAMSFDFGTLDTTMNLAIINNEFQKCQK